MTNDNKGRKPEYVATAVNKGKDGRNYYTRVGVGWGHENGAIKVVSPLINGEVWIDKRERLDKLREQRRKEKLQEPDKSQHYYADMMDE